MRISGKHVLLAVTAAVLADASTTLSGETELRQRLKRSGRELLEELYSWSVVAPMLKPALIEAAHSRKMPGARTECRSSLVHALANTMKVWIDGSPLQTGHRFRGIGAYARGLLEGLASLDADFQVTVGLWRGYPQPEFTALQRSRFKISPLPMPRGRKTLIPLTQQVVHPWLVLREKVDIVHQLGLVADPAAGGPMRAYPCRAVVTVHDLTPLIMSEEFLSRHRLRRAFYGYQLVAAKRAAVTLADTEAVGRDLVAHGFAASKIRIAPLAVDSDLRTELCRPVEQLASLDGLPRRFILAVNMQHPNKGLQMLQEALLEIPASHRPSVVVTGLDSSAYGQDAAPGVDMHAFGHLPYPTLATLYRSAICCVVPSDSEGFGLPILESMTAGTPVIVSDAPALIEVAGGAGAVFTRGDTAGLADRILHMLRSRDHRARLSDLGRARAAEFTWRRTAELTYAAYEAALTDA